MIALVVLRTIEYKQNTTLSISNSGADPRATTQSTSTKGKKKKGEPFKPIKKENLYKSNLPLSPSRNFLDLSQI